MPRKKTTVKTKSVPKKKPAAVKEDKSSSSPVAAARVKKVKETKEKVKKEVKKAAKFFEGLGRRKTATARVRLLSLGKETKAKRIASSSSSSLLPEARYLINGRPLENYFPTRELQETALSPLKKMECLEKFGLSVVAKGGGISAQAEATRHGVAKALVLFDPEMRKKLKKAGFLTRDPRMRERKKFGLKRARRAPQWAKR